jgi:hypothetical protein
MQCHPVVSGPPEHALVIGRIGVDTDDHLIEVSVTEAKRVISVQDASAGMLQAREEEPGSLQVRRLKSLCVPGI